LFETLATASGYALTRAFPHAFLFAASDGDLWSAAVLLEGNVVIA